MNSLRPATDTVVVAVSNGDLMLLWQTRPILQFAEGNSAALDGLLFSHMSPSQRAKEPIFPANPLVSIGATGGEVGGNCAHSNWR
jgi:hypothetical protein